MNATDGGAVNPGVNMSNEIKRYQTNARMSQIVVANGYVHLAGQIPDVENASVTAQTKNVLDRVDVLLASAGVDKTRLVAATLWLSDVKHFAEFNQVWDAWVPQGHAPTRACVQSLLMKPGCDVEVAVVALARGEL
jgi:enamine deaminase RidA (YjgF/YER057c/UK114 family)